MSCPLELDSSTFGSKTWDTLLDQHERTVKKYGAFWLKFRITQNSDNIVLREMQRFGRFDVFFLHVLQVWGLKSSNLKLKGGHVWAKLVGVENRVQVPTQTRMPLRNSHLQIEFPTGG